MKARNETKKLQLKWQWDLNIISKVRAKQSLGVSSQRIKGLMRVHLKMQLSHLALVF